VLTARGDQLQLVVSGSDRGGLPLGHVRDRVEAAGGSVSMTGEDGHTGVEVRLPAPAPERVAAS
jgi:signal transduction histidine kinase